MPASGNYGPSRRNDFGSKCFDPREYLSAVKTNDTSSSAMASNRQVLQAMYDAAAASAASTQRGHHLYHPADGIFIDRPIHLDGSLGGYGITLRGDGNASFVGQPGGFCSDIFALGIKRAAGSDNLTIPTSDFADLFGILDTSAVSATGQKWGIRTRQNFVTSRGGLLDGGGLSATQFSGLFADWNGLTIDFCGDFSVGNQADITGATTPICGTSNPEVQGRANSFWLLLTKSGSVARFTLELAISDGTALGSARYRFTFDAATFAFHRISVQVDLGPSPDVSAWVDGTRATVTNTDGMFPANSRMRANYGSNFSVGGHGPYGGGVSGVFVAWDWWIYGFKLSNRLRYDKANSTQTAVGGGWSSINDFRRYFETDTNTSACLLLTDPPATIGGTSGDRVVTVGAGIGGSVKGNAWLVDRTRHGNFSSFAGGYSLYGMRLQCGTAQGGNAVTVGLATGNRIVDSYLLGGQCGLGSLRLCGGWKNRFTGLTLSGRRSAVDQYNMSGCSFHDLYVPAGPTRIPLYFDTCDLDARDLIFDDGGEADYFVFARGTNLRLRNLWTDIEGWAAPIWGFMRFSNLSNAAGRIDLDGIDGGLSCLGVPFLELHQEVGEGAAAPVFVSIGPNNQLSDYGPDSFVKVDGPIFYGEFVATPKMARPTWIDDQTGAGGCNLISKHWRLHGPPTEGTWGANLHKVEVRHPAKGRPRLYWCSGSGSYGRSNPPSWEAKDFFDPDTSRLAADAIGHTYLSAGAVGTRTIGSVADRFQVAVLNRLFQGTSFAAPAARYLSVHSSQATRNGPRGSTEVSTSKGYARQAVTATLDGVGGATLSAATFGPATSDWVGNWRLLGTGPADLRSVALWDVASGGSTSANLLASIDLDATRILSGGSLAFTSGQIFLAPARLSNGGFSPSFAAEVAACLLTGVTLAARPVYLALSTLTADPTGGPTEPSGGSYARVQTNNADGTPLSPNRWTTAALATTSSTGTVWGADAVTTWNAVAINFPAPTGSWGTVKSLYLMDAASGGNVIGAWNLLIARTVASGDPALGFDIGALRITRC